MKALVPLLLVAFLSSGCAGWGILSSTDPVHRLQADIDAVLSDSIFIPARASVKIVSLTSGETLYDRDSRLLIRPASNMKLITSAAALRLLGPDHRFATVVFADSIRPDGAVIGNLYLKGYGDPDLRTVDLDTLAAAVARAGVRSVSGNVVVDASYFDDEFWGTGWMWDDEPDPDAPFLSAVALNDNCITVRVRSGAAPGQPFSVVTDPPTSYVTIRNEGRTIRDSVTTPMKVRRLYRDRSNVIVVSGDLPADTSRWRESRMTVWKPELYVATVFAERLQLAGIRVIGTPMQGRLPASAKQLATHTQPIDTMVVNLNKISDNLSADMTLKTIGAVTGNVPGSADAGTAAVRKVLSTFGIDTTKYIMVDGSGLSHYNLVTVELLTQLLVAMHGQPDIFPLYYKSLPIAGVDGTIRTRMRGTSAAGNLHAKTGSISGVSSLSGYVTTRDGEELAFAMSMQNFILPTNLYRLAQDRIGALMAGFSRNGTSATR